LFHRTPRDKKKADFILQKLKDKHAKDAGSPKAYNALPRKYQWTCI